MCWRPPGKGSRIRMVPLRAAVGPGETRDPQPGDPVRQLVDEAGHEAFPRPVQKQDIGIEALLADSGASVAHEINWRATILLHATDVFPIYSA